MGRKFEMSSKWKPAVTLVVGLTSLLCGILLLLYWSELLQYIINKKLALTPNSYSFGVWEKTPLPMFTKFYFFNWTNPDEFIADGAEPVFEEVGPYTYSEVHEKVNISWFDANSTVTFMQKRVWKYSPELSSGTEDDVIRTLNIPLVAASSVIKDWDSTVVTVGFNFAMRRLQESISMDASVGELLFRGIRTPLLSIASTLPQGVVPIPYDKFGWFYQRNNSAYFDGVLNMGTGVDDIQNIGELHEWNHTQQNWFYPDHCGKVGGSAGEFFPPHRARDNISLYVTDICRGITLTYDCDTEIHGVKGYRYTADGSLFGTPPEEPDNWCYCLRRGCMRSGVLDVSSCRFNTPSYVSYPHFLFADPYYTSYIRGMEPDKEKHETLIELEPETGVPLRVMARFQINMLLQRVPNLRVFANIQELMIPLIWFETSVEMDYSMANQMKLLKVAPDILYAVGSILTSVGLLLTTFGLVWIYLCTTSDKAPKKHSKKVSVELYKFKVQE